MFDSIKNIFNKEEKEKHVTICVHGFGRRLSHEYDNFVLWDTTHNLNTFDIYNIHDESDNDPIIWIRRCEICIESYIAAGYKVDVVGFSMGGVLATHLAANYPVERLFLIAPAFEYLHAGHIYNIAKDSISKNEEKNDTVKLPNSFTPCFMEIVHKLKDEIEKVKCPVCIVHGDMDEIIPLKSSLNAYDKIPHNNKKLFIIHEGKHRMMLHQNTCREIYILFSDFMDHKIINTNKIEYAKDILNEEIYE